MELVSFYLYSYFLGAVPTAYIVGKLVRGIDIREFGSGNVGASNLLHNVGRAWVVPLVLFDGLLKGSSPLLIGLYALDLDRGSAQLLIAPVLAIAGNNWSVFLKFTGGRGIAVVSGVLLVLAYRDLIVFVAIILGGWMILKNAGIGVLVALMFLSVSSLLFDGPSGITWFYVGLLALVVAKRLTSNWTTFPKDVGPGTVLLNRVMLDRDISDRHDWVHRGHDTRSNEDEHTQ